MASTSHLRHPLPSYPEVQATLAGLRMVLAPVALLHAAVAAPVAVSELATLHGRSKANQQQNLLTRGPGAPQAGTPRRTDNTHPRIEGSGS
jgi:hypothetical protein